MDDRRRIVRPLALEEPELAKADLDDEGEWWIEPKWDSSKYGVRGFEISEKRRLTPLVQPYVRNPNSFLLRLGHMITDELFLVHFRDLGLETYFDEAGKIRCFTKHLFTFAQTNMIVILRFMRSKELFYDPEEDEAVRQSVFSEQPKQKRTVAKTREKTEIKIKSASHPLPIHDVPYFKGQKQQAQVLIDAVSDLLWRCPSGMIMMTVDRSTKERVLKPYDGIVNHLNLADGWSEQQAMKMINCGEYSKGRFTMRHSGRTATGRSITKFFAASNRNGRWYGVNSQGEARLWSIGELSRIANKSKQLIKYRLEEGGMSIEEAIKTPINENYSNLALKARGMTKT